MADALEKAAKARSRICEAVNRGGTIWAEDVALILDGLDALKAHIAELEAERGWQPIETAPKDGARVLLAKFGWAEDMEGNNEYRLFFSVSGSWWTERDYWTDGLEKLIPPTHWMPLPAPPQDTEGDG